MGSRVTRLAAIWPLIWLLIGSACTDRAPEEPKGRNPAQPGSSLFPDHGLPPPNKHWALLTGEVDVQNRYAGTVLVTTFLPVAGKSTKTEVECSGVVISPRLVLTAGHCVCAQRMTENQNVISGSTCATTARVKTVVYEAPAEEEELHSLHTVRRGRVQPHPELRVVLDHQGGVISSIADLAVIVLNGQVKVSPVKLAETEVELDEPIVIAGHGSDGDETEERRFNEIRVIKPLSSSGGRILLQQAPSERHTDDSGGPCLREEGQTHTLVGISSRRLGKEPTATSTYSYRAWLRDEIQHAMESALTP